MHKPTYNVKKTVEYSILITGMMMMMIITILIIIIIIIIIHWYEHVPKSGETSRKIKVTML